MIRSAIKERRNGKSSNYSNHAMSNGSSRKGCATETERNVLTAVRELSADATQSIMRRTAGLKDSAADYVSKGRKKARALRKSAKRQVRLRSAMRSDCSCNLEQSWVRKKFPPSHPAGSGHPPQDWHQDGA